MDSESGLAISVGTDVSGVGLSLYYSASDDSEPSLEATEVAAVNSFNAVKTPTDPEDGVTYPFPAAAILAFDEDEMGKVENKGLGVSASIPAGEGSSLSVAYSKWDSEQSTATKGWYSAAGTDQGDTDSNVTGTVEEEVKLIAVSFSYDLGGGATFKAGVEKKDTEKTHTLTASGDTGLFPDGGDEGTDLDSSAKFMDTTDTTTLTAKLAFSF